MNTSTVSSKYQIVIPSALRKQLNIKPGQKISLEANVDESITVKPLNPLRDLQSKYSGIWGDSPAAYVRAQRDQWDD